MEKNNKLNHFIIRKKEYEYFGSRKIDGSSGKKEIREEWNTYLRDKPKINQPPVKNKELANTM